MDKNERLHFGKIMEPVELSRMEEEKRGRMKRERQEDLNGRLGNRVLSFLKVQESKVLSLGRKLMSYPPTLPEFVCSRLKEKPHAYITFKISHTAVVITS